MRVHFLILLLLPVLINFTNCADNGNVGAEPSDEQSLPISEISGPDLIYEKSYAIYSIDAEDDQEYTYEWFCNPEQAGWFGRPSTNPRVFFFPRGVDEDQEIDISVQISLNEEIQNLRIKNLVVGNLPDRSSGDPGSLINEGTGVVIDDSDYIYATGIFHHEPTISLDDKSMGITSNGSTDIYLMKLTPVGEITWTLAWGGLAPDYVDGIALDNQGNIYIVGRFFGTVDFDPGSGTNELTSSPTYDIFISKFTDDADYLYTVVWEDEADKILIKGVSADNEGNVYIGGVQVTVLQEGSRLDSTYEETSSGFVRKYSSNGVFLWEKLWEPEEGGSGGVNDVLCTADGTILVPGRLTPAYTATRGQEISHNNDLIPWGGGPFLSLISPDGQTIWNQAWGDGHTSASIISLDESGNIYVAGRFVRTTDFNPGLEEDILSTTEPFGPEGYISKFNHDGDFIWARNAVVQVRDIALIGSQSAYVLGGCPYPSVDLDPGPGESLFYNNGGLDVFLTKLDSDGNFQWGGSWGGSNYDNVTGVVVDREGNFFCLGTFDSTVDWDPSNLVREASAYSSRDSFLTKFNENGEFQWVIHWGGTYPEGYFAATWGPL